MKTSAFRPLRAAFAATLLAGLAACALTPEERAEDARRAIARAPVANWLLLPEQQPAAGERVVFAYSDGPRRVEAAVEARQGARVRVRLRWIEAPAGQDELKDLAFAFELAGSGAVENAQLDAAGRPPVALRVAGAGEVGYVSQPTVVRLPRPEFVDTGARSLSIDAVALSERRTGDGAVTEIRYLSDEVAFGVAKLVEVSADAASVSEVVAQVALQPGRPPLHFGDWLAPRLDRAAYRRVGAVVER